MVRRGKVFQQNFTPFQIPFQTLLLLPIQKEGRKWPFVLLIGKMKTLEKKPFTTKQALKKRRSPHELKRPLMKAC